MTSRSSRTRTTMRIVGFSTLAAGVLAAAAAAVTTITIARMIVTPPRRRDEDIRILGATPSTVTLSRTPDSIAPGRYGLWFSGDKGYARIGVIVDEDGRSVTRELLGVDFGNFSSATRARLGGWFFLRPRELGFPFENVQLDEENGPSPAWLIPSAVDRGNWVIVVHGRAVTRSEGLRAVGVFRGAGYSSLLISYRNDGDGAASPDRRYALGDTEWRDVETAMEFALANGAENIVLMGWSMGGAMVLQAATRALHRDEIRGIILDSPVLDWAHVLEFQGAEMLVPPVIRRAVLAILEGSASRQLTGQAQAIDLERLNFVRRSAELRVPVLLLHSDEDSYVPVAASRALAQARPDIVTFEEFAEGRHAKLWNIDPDRWNGAIVRWLEALPLEGASARRRRSTRRREAGTE